MKIKWLGQSGYLLWDDETAVAIDPYLSDSVNRIAGRPRVPEIPVLPGDLRADVVVCTHDHADHLDPDTVAAMRPEERMFYAPSDCLEHLRQLGAVRVAPFDEGAVVTAGKFTLEAVFALHSVPAVGVFVTYEGKRLWFSGDTLYDSRLEQMAQRRPDVVFLCINGKLGNMNVDEAVRLAGLMEGSVAVPAHYGMFASNTEDPQKFTSRVENSFEMGYNREYTIETLLDRRKKA